MGTPVPGRLAENVRQSVIQVKGSGGSLGSGVVVAPNQIVTNAHVLHSPSIEVVSWEGTQIPAKIIKSNKKRDLALLSAEGLNGHALSFGDSALLPPGTPVFAIGNPLGFVGALSSGVIHSQTLRNWICTDLQLAPGNSGGALANYAGQLIGINTMVAGGGLALAIPSRHIQKFLTANERSLGVVVHGVQMNQQYGLLVTEVVAGSAAEAASLLPGDILTAANHTSFHQTDDLSDAIESAPDGALRLEFYRGNHVHARFVTARLTVPKTGIFTSGERSAA